MRLANSTDYVSVNIAYELLDASRWQLAIRRQGMGLHTVQQYVTPQMANTEPFSDFYPRDYRIPAPTASIKALRVEPRSVYTAIVLIRTARHEFSKRPLRFLVQ
ncbi:MAG: hypothetical protein J4G18_05430 [Anaerolineae bacterium]|nr:hypothetical protein [Anaerolineae bacterium]